ncbi:MAG: ATP-dependent DNA helicase RecG [Bacteroidetes bacterium]|nr:MAG: ATP-dependent DNA helicase RecG [Bacteroidota bacterium]
MRNIFETPVVYLKGVGPRKAELLKKELNIVSFDDLLNCFPFRYVDKSKIYKVSEVTTDTTWFQLKGKISKLKPVGDKRMKYITASFTDESGTIGLVWFRGLSWIKNAFATNKEYILFGKPSIFKNSFNFVHPEIEEFDPMQENVSGQRLEGVYSSTENLKNNGLGSRGISKLMRRLLNQAADSIYETLPDQLISHFKLIPRKTALLNIHFPETTGIIEKAIHRLKFEELLFLQLQILQQKTFLQDRIPGQVFDKVGNYLNDFYAKHLPFELTNAQKRVIKEIRLDMKSGKQMNRLLQGDVGSGKTLVALMNMLIALDNGFQCCLMAPTEILATQHFNSIKKMLGKMDVRIALLTGSTKKAARKPIHAELLDGSLQILIGTHALIEETVRFKNLGFVVIDEQHRFGVAQRAKLWKKNTTPPHVLVMTATPIPRTLAMTLYGNLDVSIIDEMPPGRKAIKTLHFWETKRLRVIGFIREQIKQGRQIYIVYPLIKESEKLDLKNLNDGFENIIRDFPLPEYQVSVLHGRMKPEDKDFEMKRFVEGKTDIMVSTTVIEVGVDVSNASVMIIENAERFGLSQLHQLRGRVGRGAEQSYCILMSGNKLSAEGRKRLEIMVKTNDGFEISEADLQLRGPGDIQGTKQSGLLDFKIANLAKDGELIAKTRRVAEHILSKDPKLSAVENKLMKQQLLKIQKEKTYFGRIS